MKSLSLFVSIFFFATLSSFGQLSRGYKSVYRFQLSEPNNIASFLFTVDSLQSLNDKSIVKGEIVNSQLQPIPFATIILKQDDKRIAVMTDDRGFFELKIKPSQYIISVSSTGNQTLQENIILKSQEILTLNVKLSPDPSLSWYNVYSKRKLSKKQIGEIKKCVQLSPNDVIKCRQKNKYFVVIEI